MAILRGELKYSTKELNELAVQFPEWGGRLLAFFGKRGRVALKEEFLSGQELNMIAGQRDRLGRFTITSDVNRRRTQVKIYSYLVNLFEKGRKLRNGRREPGKHIIEGKLKQVIMSRAGRYTNEFETRFIAPELKRMNL